MPALNSPKDQATLSNIATALQHAQDTLPRLLQFLSPFIPGLSSILPYLGLLQIAIQGVGIVQQATGSTTTSAIGAVADHLTPGQPGAPVLDTGPSAAQDAGR